MELGYIGYVEKFPFFPVPMLLYIQKWNVQVWPDAGYVVKLALYSQSLAAPTMEQLTVLAAHNNLQLLQRNNSLLPSVFFCWHLVPVIWFGAAIQGPQYLSSWINHIFSYEKLQTYSFLMPKILLLIISWSYSENTTLSEKRSWHSLHISYIVMETSEWNGKRRWSWYNLGSLGS